MVGIVASRWALLLKLWSKKSTGNHVMIYAALIILIFSGFLCTEYVVMPYNVNTRGSTCLIHSTKILPLDTLRKVGYSYEISL